MDKKIILMMYSLN